MSEISKYDAPSLLGDRVTRRFHVMAKPTGSTCNLDCSYCYYLSKETLPNGPGAGLMADDTLERFIKGYIDGVTGDEVVFSWQGGEATLRGIDWFRQVVALQRKHAKPHQTIQNDLQTNGTLLNEEWAKFLKENRFLVGLSIDGPKELHDHYRVYKGGQPSFDRVFAAAQLLRRFDVSFNTLTCVNRVNAKRPLDVYRFLRKELGSTYLQFIPIVEHKGFETTAPQTWLPGLLPALGSPEARPGTPDSFVTDWTVDPEDYGDFLIAVFEEWEKHDRGQVLVNHIETLVAQHLDLPSQLCIYSQNCGKGLAIENDGSVYSCDHYVYPEYKLGNIKQKTLGDMAFSPTQVKFGYDKSDTLPAYCRQCPYLKDCWGECPKHRILLTPDGEPGLNYLCAGLKKWFAFASPRVDTIVAELRQRPINSQPRVSGGLPLSPPSQ